MEPSARQAAIQSGLGRYVALEWFEHAPGFVLVLAGPEFTVVHANDAYRRLVGHEDLIGLPLAKAVPELQEQENLLCLLRNVYRRSERHCESACPIRLRNASGGEPQLRYVDFVIQPIPGPEDSGVAGLLIQGCDVTMETVSRHDLQYSLTHDALTGLPNHALFRDRTERAIQRAARTPREVLVAMLDLDLFKRVNAWLGHDAGDRILAEIASRIAHAAGAQATVARENGDKFLVLVEAEHGALEPGLLRAVAEAVAQPLDYGDQRVCVTCCTGVATFPLSGQTTSALLMAADRALGRAKLEGPGTLCYEDASSGEAELQRFRLGFALRDALARGGLHVHYQPQVDLVSGKICAVEALVRWTTADGVEVSPAMLIAAAEECGLIGELGDWVLRTACSQLVRWHQLGFAGLRVAVNLSARQFSMPSLVTDIMRTLDEVGLEPRFLDLELTESVLMRDMEHAIECLSVLRRQGVRICLDDFGAGYSSLAYLQVLPIDVLKVDRSFMARVPEAANAAAIVDAIITMAHSLGMRVIAEGVEREVQCDFLSRHMCDEVQGYYVCKPVPAEAVTSLLRDGVGLQDHLLRFNRREPTLLLVDDEPTILYSLKRRLRNEGYQILTAANGQQGLQLLAEQQIDVVVSDHRMPEMDGIEFLRAVRQLYPDTVRILLSGFTELQTVTEAVNAGAIYKVLTKPWDDKQLLAHIREAFNHGAMANENRVLTLKLRTAYQQLSAANRQLETLLDQQRRVLRQDEISPDIAREALHQVPVAVLVSDDRCVIVLANHAARKLFGRHSPVLGENARHLFPELPRVLAPGRVATFEAQRGETVLRVLLSPMGNDTESRGWLLVVTPLHGLQCDAPPGIAD
ncbi:EAL domain-containing protein [Noviherbaspirillum pedocola]|uniref:EAL domain-containing protein n=1 Tax=Noviherbaspirillum pedocola TaxID=2801341 RepID=A0A934SVA1_9BURK|nr:EAL domain-containing protein [Noviherbaspirillum pedocola]MBK4733442.1 EAL domain-containing protein [Noviherbaspirillum pedocola]